MQQSMGHMRSKTMGLLSLNCVSRSYLLLLPSENKYVEIAAKTFTKIDINKINPILRHVLEGKHSWSHIGRKP